MCKLVLTAPLVLMVLLGPGAPPPAAARDLLGAPSPPAQSAPTSPHREFDFWLGE